MAVGSLGLRFVSYIVGGVLEKHYEGRRPESQEKPAGLSVAKPWVKGNPRRHQGLRPWLAYSSQTWFHPHL